MITEGNRGLVKGWLILGIACLLFAGVLAGLLVVSRTPYVQNVIPWLDFFHTALVVHVDLSVLIWFVAFAGVLWSMYGSGAMVAPGFAALGISGVGALVIAASPFLGAKNPLMNNYVPVLDDRIFLIGLGIFFIGFVLLVVCNVTTLLRSVITLPLTSTVPTADAGTRFGLGSAAVVAAVAIVCFILSISSIPVGTTGLTYYELAFWAGGHILQFMHSMLMIVVWFLLAGAIMPGFKVDRRVSIGVFGVILIVAVLSPFIFMMYGTDSTAHRDTFTELMEYGVGPSVVVSTVLVAVAIARKEKKTPRTNHLLAALVTSIALFAAGGIIGFLIDGVNVIIPAHYHGVIVGVTLAYMGFTYYLLPQLGYGKPSYRLAQLQAYIYGSGQLLHIIGLALAGTYGVQRKVAGAAQGLDSFKKILSMGLMGIGGVVAVIGGIMFLVVAISAIRGKK
ncbi:cytochrome c oxidase subunit I [Candidatus Magnetobacterium bavaricum]|uniref:Cytochrome c oxidase subunit I n=1 Tax=Candidatus Magnetobacterium bavaricum TaxID=29290 RepID=A0A0F3GS36_9BACT|nr:cytochrome c oxidase subunit I [Candidatus Magnetobacterium bavaricum]